MPTISSPKTPPLIFITNIFKNMAASVFCSRVPSIHYSGRGGENLPLIVVIPIVRVTREDENISLTIVFDGNEK